MSEELVEEKDDDALQQIYEEHRIFIDNLQATHPEQNHYEVPGVIKLMSEVEKFRLKKIEQHLLPPEEFLVLDSRFKYDQISKEELLILMDHTKAMVEAQCLVGRRMEQFAVEKFGSQVLRRKWPA